MKIPSIKNAFDHVKDACEKRLQELYPSGIPALVKERYKTELEHLKHSSYIDEFEILRCLFKEARKCSQFVTLRGTTPSSYIVYLLTQSILNPLSAHYYCPVCGHFEVVNTNGFGIDLPASSCPSCNSPLVADGFNLPAESAWGTDGTKIISFDYNISEEFLPFAKRVLESLYPNNTIAPLGIHQRESEDDVIRIRPSGYIVLPDRQHIEDYPELMAYLENGEQCLSGNLWDTDKYGLFRVNLIPNLHVENIIAWQKKTGRYASEISLQDLASVTWRDLVNTSCLSAGEDHFFHTLQPETFYDMVCLDAASHNTMIDYRAYIPQDAYTMPALFDTPAFQKYPCYTREDFFDILLNLGFERETAFEVSEFIRKGKHNSEVFTNQFNAFSLPENLATVAKEYLYVFPRAHCVEYILLYARLAFYARKKTTT